MGRVMLLLGLLLLETILVTTTPRLALCFFVCSLAFVSSYHYHSPLVCTCHLLLFLFLVNLPLELHVFMSLCSIYT